MIAKLFPTLQPLPEKLNLPTVPAGSLLYPSATLDPSLLTPTITSTPKPTRTPRPSMTPSLTIPPLVAFGPEIFPDNVNPLTGLPVVNLDLMDRRPVAMKIPLMPRGSARPQWGLTLADHVYEYYLEKGITRFIGIFYGNDAEKAGPIRSGRLFDEQIMQMYNGILVFNSAYETIYDHYVENGFSNQLVVERTGSPLYREPDVPEPSNLFGNTAEISDYVQERGSDNSKYPLSGMYFRSYLTRGESAVDTIEVRYSESSYHRWEYNDRECRYYRYQDADEAFFVENEVYEPLVDQLTDQHVTADNIVVLLVEHEYFYKSSDTEIFTMNMTGSGSGYLFREGFVFPIVWERIATDQILRIKLLNGKAAAFKIGETWFTVLHSESQLSVDGNFWRFEFVLPEEPATETPEPEQ